MEMHAFKSDRLKSAWSKLEGQAARLALLFHSVRHAYLPSEPGREHISRLKRSKTRSRGYPGPFAVYSCPSLYISPEACTLTTTPFLKSRL
jgi:hypothetical protein